MINILVEKDGEVLKFPINKILTDDLNSKLDEYNQVEVVEDEEDTVQEESSLITHTFKGNVLFVGYEPNSPSTEISSKVSVTTLKKNLAVKLDYGIENYASVKKDLYNSLFPYLGESRNYTSDETEPLSNLLYKHILHNRHKINYRNREGIYYTANFKDKFKPTTLNKDFVFDIEKTELARFNNETSLNITHSKRPVLNNVYPQKTVCWGRARKAPVLTTSKDVFQATESMLNFFLGSTFNRDLSEQIAVDVKSLALAIKRTYNEEDVTGLTDEEFEQIRTYFLSKLDTTMRSTFMFQNVGFLLTMSLLNLDCSDIEYD